jgi:hypothetical protein
MEFIIAPLSWGGSPVRKAGIEVIKNWTGLTARELAKAGRFAGGESEVATNIVRPNVMGLDDMVWDLIDELRGLEKNLAAELKRISEDKEEGK